MYPKRILVIASTLPASDKDPVPAFVKDQLVAFKSQHPELKISILAPHDKRSNTKNFTNHKSYNEYRFHYMWPFFIEKLAGRGIMPALKSNPFYYLLIPFFFTGEFFAVLRLCVKIKPDIIYAHWFTPQAINAAIVSKVYRIPFVYTTHAADVDVWRKIPLLGPWVVRKVSQSATAITAVSPRSMAKLEKFFTPTEWGELSKKTKIIPMGVDISKYSKARLTQDALKEEYALQRKKVVLFVGRLAEKKGIPYLLQAFSRLQNSPKKAKLVIAGDGPQKEELINLSSKLGIEGDTIFTGHVSGQKKDDYFHLSDVVVVPSIITKSGDAEGLPVVLMEGLASGKVCIASDVSGADNILSDGKDGFLFSEKDTAALERLLKHSLSLSSSQKSKISKSAQATASQFDWPLIATHHYEFLFK